MGIHYAVCQHDVSCRWMMKRTMDEDGIPVCVGRWAVLNCIWKVFGCGAEVIALSLAPPTSVGRIPMSGVEQGLRYSDLHRPPSDDTPPEVA